MELSDEAQELWDAAIGLNRAAASVMPQAARLPPLIFMTDGARTPDPWAIAGRLPPGAGVIYRAFGAPEALAVAQRLRAATTAAGARLLIGQDDGLADAVGADGVHLAERDLARAPSVRRRRPEWLITGATHSQAALKTGREAGLDAAVISPVFAPGSTSGSAPLGVEGLTALIRSAEMPAYALGGLSAHSVTRLVGSGACGICAVGGVCSAFGVSGET
jgi:thiamine-phosphate pyrophosphorylase